MKSTVIPGQDCIGIGVGAILLDARGRVFLARRGPEARNERGCWEFPGGGVNFGETLAAAIAREFREEYGVEIRIVGLLGVFDHILPEEGQHWVSATYVARHESGVPRILEPAKCSEIGWFDLSALPEPLSAITQENLRVYLGRVQRTHGV